MWYILLLLGITVVYLFIELRNARSSLRTLEDSVYELEDFKRMLVGVAGQEHNSFLPNIETFLQLKNRHQHENLYKLVFDKEKLNQIDWDALEERQRQEVSNLYSKLVKDSGTLDDASFPKKDEKS